LRRLFCRSDFSPTNEQQAINEMGQQTFAVGIIPQTVKFHLT
jgi:hypothetical protein